MCLFQRSRSSAEAERESKGEPRREWREQKRKPKRESRENRREHQREHQLIVNVRPPRSPAEQTNRVDEAVRTGLPIFGFINSVGLIQFMINKDKIGD